MNNEAPLAARLIGVWVIRRKELANRLGTISGTHNFHNFRRQRDRARTCVRVSKRHVSLPADAGAGTFQRTYEELVVLRNLFGRST